MMIFGGLKPVLIYIYRLVHTTEIEYYTVLTCLQLSFCNSSKSFQPLNPFIDFLLKVPLLQVSLSLLLYLSPHLRMLKSLFHDTFFLIYHKITKILMVVQNNQIYV